MKTKTLTTLLSLLALMTGLHRAIAQDTAFTYQGRLNDGANPANGIYDLRFAIFDAASGGAQQGNSVTNTATGVTNGLFTVLLDFGNQFPGADRWLEIGVRTNGPASFTTLLPRQKLTPAPYAITAGNVVSNGLASGIYVNPVTFNNNANNFNGSFAGNGGALTNVNASTLGGLASSNYWQLVGNAGANPTSGAFLGTTDNLPLEFRVNNQRVMRFAFNSLASDNPSIIGGSQVNFAAPHVVGATIAGGGQTLFTNSVRADFGFIGGGVGNSILGDFSTIGGGDLNTAGSSLDTAIGNAATVSGGEKNNASGGDATVGGGSGNGAQQSFGTVGGGRQNSVLNTSSSPSPLYGTVAGGHSNVVHGAAASIPGGEMNIADGDYSFAAGRQAAANHDGTFVWADAQGGAFGSTSSNQFLIRAAGGVGLGRVPAANALELEGNASKTAAGGWLANSDARIKTDIRTVTGALDKLSQVRLVSFRYSDDYRSQHPALEDRRYLNIVAQEFQKVFPDHVKSSGEKLPGDADPILQADTYPLTIYSAAAIQELNRKVEAENAQLREQLKRHETENAELKHRLDTLEQIILNQKE